MADRRPLVVLDSRLFGELPSGDSLSIDWLSGTLPASKGGTGATTLTGYVKGNGTSAMTASATIPVADVSGAAVDAAVVHKAGDETISGNKTFSGTVVTNALQPGGSLTDSYVQMQATAGINRWLRFRRGGSPGNAAGAVFSAFNARHYFASVEADNRFTIRASSEVSETPALSGSSIALAVDAAGISGTKIGVNAREEAHFTTLSATGNCTLGDATADAHSLFGTVTFRTSDSNKRLVLTPENEMNWNHVDGYSVGSMTWSFAGATRMTLGRTGNFSVTGTITGSSTIEAAKAFYVADVYQISASTGGAARTLDASNSEVQTLVADSDFTLTVTGPAGKSARARLYIYIDGLAGSGNITMTHSGFLTETLSKGMTACLVFEWDGTRSWLVSRGGPSVSGNLLPT